MIKLLSRFRRQNDGSVATEMSVAVGMLALGFIGLWTTTNSVRNANAAELAVSDVVMTARSMGDLDQRSDQELLSVFGSVASESLMSSQHADISITRVCGCPTAGTYSDQICLLGSCDDGLEPARYLEMSFVVSPQGNGGRGSDSVKNFTIDASVQY